MAIEPPVIDGNEYDFGGIETSINGATYIFQDITVSDGTNIIELEGAQGETVSQVFVGRPKEVSGTAILKKDTSLLARGDEFSNDGIPGAGSTTFIITETSVTKSNGAFATQSFSAREKLNV